MPSPVAHLAAGYALYRLLREKIPVVWQNWPVPVALLVCLVMSLFPDLDSAVGVLAGDMHGYHNNLTHSFFAGAVVSLALAGAIRWIARSGAVAWFLPAFACYSAHIVMDYFTVGRGVMLFWPFSVERLTAPFHPFRGLQWAMGPWTIQHLWTFLNELWFVAAMALLLVAIRVRQRCDDAGTGQLP